MSKKYPKTQIPTLLRSLKPLTINQHKYFQAIKNSKIILVSGLAGTGKSCIATYFASKFLVENEVDRVILTRPAVEACGEQFGFLKGSLDQKMMPYLVPVYEEFEKNLSTALLNKYKVSRKIEIVPLAFMRGRNFDNCFIVCDESQNASLEQFKMLLTRLSDSSKIVILGDFEQNDFQSKRCDFEILCEKLNDMDGVSYISLGEQDIIRSKFIAEILRRLK